MSGIWRSRGRRRSKGPAAPWRRHLPQLIVASLVTAIIGATLQLQKLASLDSAGRQYARESYADKSAFLVPFALSKAVCNLLVGGLADRFGRKRVAVAGFGVGILAPIIVLGAPTRGERGWSAVVFSSLFLGANQGLTWTAMILTTMDLCGPAARGFASGLSETIGYTAIAVFANVYGSIERDAVTCAWSNGSGPAPGSECLARSGGKCASSDDWKSQCLGECVCEGYTREPFHAQIALLLVGLAACAFVLRESLFVAERERVGGGGGGGDAGTKGLMRGIAMSDLRGVRRGTPLFDDDDDERIGAGRKKRTDGAGGGGGSDDLDGYAADTNAAEDGRDDRVDDVPTDRATLTGEESAWAGFVRTSFANKSLAVVCLAGFCANFETGLAWGLMATWARDAMGLGGRERDFFTACYSFVKGLSQLLAGIMSDRIGRKAPMCLGLLGGAAALLVAAVGAGWRGRVSVGVGVSPDELKQLQFGYLVLSGVLLGFFTGLMYPVLAAAAADHSPRSGFAASVGTVRFWRDVGYAMGLPVAALADASSTETALVFVACLMLVAGAAVFFGYVEASFGGERFGASFGGTYGVRTREPAYSRVDEAVMTGTNAVDDRTGRPGSPAGGFESGDRHAVARRTSANYSGT